MGYFLDAVGHIADAGSVISLTLTGGVGQFHDGRHGPPDGSLTRDYGNVGVRRKGVVGVERWAELRTSDGTNTLPWSSAYARPCHLRPVTTPDVNPDGRP